jgi:hypothetical protein
MSMGVFQAGGTTAGLRAALVAALALALPATGLAQEPDQAQARGAGLCDYKPSILAGAAAQKAGAAGRALAPVAKEGARTAGQWMLMHPGQSVTLLSSAAGTASGTVAGAGGVAATVTAIATAPVTLAVGAVTFAAAGGYEGLCYFKVERVTDEAAVRAIIDDITQNDPLAWTRNTNKGPVMVLAGPEGETIYPIRKLYIADGLLKVRDWGLNPVLGPVAYVQPEAGAEAPAPEAAPAAPAAPETTAPETTAPLPD